MDSKILKLIRHLDAELQINGADDLETMLGLCELLDVYVDDVLDEGEGGGSRKRKKDDDDSDEAGLSFSEEDDELMDVSDIDDEEDKELETLFVNPVTVEDTRSPSSAPPLTDIATGQDVFEWLIQPLDTETFMTDIYQRQPLLIRRPKNKSCYTSIFSKDEIDSMLEKGLAYTTEIDVVQYDGMIRTTLNTNSSKPQGGQSNQKQKQEEKASKDVVWKRFNKQGCSVRLLHPQRTCDPLYQLLAKLEGYWQNNVGCNVYLTPKGVSQGFAPHYDDICAYVLQVEGSKRWRLYSPTAPQTILARYSSKDFKPKELGTCVLDVVLHPGDMLYMPRGLVHQAETCEDTHSLHLTVSCNQQWNWAVFMEMMMAQAIKVSASRSLDMRRNLPRGFLDYMGELNSVYNNSNGGQETTTTEDLRAEFLDTVNGLVLGLMDEEIVDWTADAMGAQFMARRLPPPLAVDSSKQKKKNKSQQLTLDDRVKAKTPGIARVIYEEEGDEVMALLCHCLSNHRSQHASLASSSKQQQQQEEEELPQEIEIPISLAALVHVLITAPKSMSTRQAMDMTDVDESESDTALQVVQSLMESGFLKTVVGKKNKQ